MSAQFISIFYALFWSFIDLSIRIGHKRRVELDILLLLTRQHIIPSQFNVPNSVREDGCSLLPKSSSGAGPI
jgi:hypothetical protein